MRLNKLKTTMLHQISYKTEYISITMIIVLITYYFINDIFIYIIFAIIITIIIYLITIMVVLSLLLKTGVICLVLISEIYQDHLTSSPRRSMLEISTRADSINFAELCSLGVFLTCFFPTSLKVRPVIHQR